jgi:multidrug efflux pump
MPLVLASGAGSGAQHSIGTGVLGGMLVGVFLGIFFIPLFFVVIRRLFTRSRQIHTGGAHKEQPETEAGG